MDKYLVCPDTPIHEVIQKIDASDGKIALVVDEKKKLLGTVTDGDIRRGILKGISLQEPVTSIMNFKPTTIARQASRKEILKLMKQTYLNQIPVVDESGLLVDLEILPDLFPRPKKDNFVVLMAGGLGHRLRPLTNDCPKPMLRVGNQPILETILLNFSEYGFKRFFISVNYKADMIEEYFGDGTQWGVEIEYVREEEKMGTAGSLSLLPMVPDQTFLVMNADLLTHVNFDCLLDFHSEHKADATMCVREFDFKVPYGTLEIENNRILKVEEKPMQKFFVNAGIYVFEPDILKSIPENQYYDMPDLFNSLIETNRESVAFPIREYWLDIGQMDDYQRANVDFENFKVSNKK